MKSGIAPREDIISRNHGIKVEPHSFGICSTRFTSEITKAETLRPSTSGFLLGNFLGVLVEQNTSLGGFYYCIPERTSLQIPLGTRCTGGLWGPTITMYCCISEICDILHTWGAGLSLYHCVRAELVSTISLKQLRAYMSLKWKLANTCIRTFGINLQRRSIYTLVCKPDY